MIIDDNLVDELDVMQLSDSFFPTGLFATSNGLESLFLGKKINTASELIEFNRTYIEQQIGPSDCIVLANVYNFAESMNFEKIKELDSICSSIRTIKETRDAAFRSGIQLTRCVREFCSDNRLLSWYYDEIQADNITGVYPVSFGICCNALGIKKEKSLLMLLYGFVVSTVGAALRLGMIQHFESQKIIHNLKPMMAKVTKESLDKTIEDIWQFCPQLEINQMSHEQMDSKMFIT